MTSCLGRPRHDDVRLQGSDGKEGEASVAGACFDQTTDDSRCSLEIPRGRAGQERRGLEGGHTVQEQRPNLFTAGPCVVVEGTLLKPLSLTGASVWTDGT